MYEEGWAGPRRGWTEVNNSIFPDVVAPRGKGGVTDVTTLGMVGGPQTNIIPGPPWLSAVLSRSIMNLLRNILLIRKI